MVTGYNVEENVRTCQRTLNTFPDNNFITIFNFTPTKYLFTVDKLVKFYACCTRTYLGMIK